MAMATCVPSWLRKTISSWVNAFSSHRPSPRVLGNLGLGRCEEKAFTQEEIVFLSQLGTQVAIAIENALAYREIGGLKEKLSQEKLYLEDEIRSEINFKEIVGDSTSLKAALEKVATVAPSDA